MLSVQCVNDIPGSYRGYHSPLEGESQKPSRQAKADAVGGPTNTRHLAQGSASDRHSRGTAFPPSGSTAGSALVLPTPPLRRRLMRWGVGAGRLLRKPTCTLWETPICPQASSRCRELDLC